MNIIIPMAGMGKRLRPHTLVVPKPLVRIAGKPIVRHLTEDLMHMFSGRADNICFITGRFGPETERQLLETAAELGAKGHIVYQDEALGTAHAVHQAREFLNGPAIVAFADTLFRADFAPDPAADAVLWVKEIPNPEQFGVVKLDAGGNIIGFVEKPKTPVSNLAMIGIYYFKEAGDLKTEIQYLIDNDFRKGGEFQLPDALTRMLEKGRVIVPGKVNEWMDCGNYAATAETNSLLLGHLRNEERLENGPFTSENSHVTEPCFIGEGVVLKNARVGPGVSLGPGTIVENADIRDSIIGERSAIRNARIENSMIGSHCEIDSPHTLRLSLGDYSVIS